MNFKKFSFRIQIQEDMVCIHTWFLLWNVHQHSNLHIHPVKLCIATNKINHSWGTEWNLPQCKKNSSLYVFCLPCNSPWNNWKVLRWKIFTYQTSYKSTFQQLRHVTLIRMGIKKSSTTADFPFGSCWQTSPQTWSSVGVYKKSAGREQKQCCGREATI